VARRFERIARAEGDPELESLYTDIMESGFGDGVPLNWFTSQGARPDILAATWKLVKAVLLQGQLPATIKHMIIVNVATLSQCRYCATVHTNALEAMGVPIEIMDGLTTDLNLSKVPPPQRAILEFAAKVARQPKSVTDGDFEQLRELGLSEGETMEVAMMGAFANFINTWADVSGIPID